MNNTPIATYGTRFLTLDLGLRRTFWWVFMVANVKNPILGADFLRHFSLLVDMRNHHLADGFTQLRVQGVICSTTLPCPAVLLQQGPSVYDNILTEFPTVTRPCLSDVPMKHDIKHHICTNGPPTTVRPCRLGPESLRIARQDMITCWSWAPSNPPLAIGPRMVPKTTRGDWQPCGDYRALNSVRPVPYTTYSPRPSAALLFSRKLISSGHTIRYRWSPMTFLRPQ